MKVEIPPYRKPLCAQDCPDRTAECHGSCARYLEWSATIRKRKQLIYSQKYIENMADSCNIRVAEARLKRLGVRK